MSSPDRGRRWGRRTSMGRRNRDESQSQASASTTSYLPPSLGEQQQQQDYAGGDYYTPAPPESGGGNGTGIGIGIGTGNRGRKHSTGSGGSGGAGAGGLTGNISKMFRRAASRERRPQATSSPRRRVVEDPTSPSSAAPRTPHRSPSFAKTNGGSSSYNSAAGTRRYSGAAAAAAPNNGMNRLFYSSQCDDSSEDSYESRAQLSPSVATGSISKATIGDTTVTTNDDISRSTPGDSSHETGTTIQTILRYRGFSTSISNLFLDEALVCASIGCFGLLLSNRTEHLLQLRNDQRGVRWGRSSSRRTLPSRIVAYALWMTMVMIAGTFVIWGFGNEESSGFAAGFYEGYNVVEDDNYWDEDDNNMNGDDQNGEEEEEEQNDDAQQQQNDDAANQNDDANNDNGDDAVAANGDDANTNGDDANANGDDANANGDDANGSNNWWNWDDDTANQNDFNNYNDQNYGLDDAYYSAYDDDGNGDDAAARMLEHSSTHQCPHHTQGVFKIRDMHEGLWEPAMDFLKDEWHRELDPSLSKQQPHRLIRGLEENNNNGYDAYGDEAEVVEEGRDLAADLRVAFLIVFLVVLGVLGRRRRMRTRYYLVRARAQEDHLFYASSGAGVKRVAFQDSREDQYEGACSHTLCGCYPIDPPMEGDEIDDDVMVNDGGVVQSKKNPHHHDCVSRAYNCLMACCCGWICRCWFQCMSVCALAQEAREIRLLVPTRYQRVDFITHQPFHEYQKDVNDLRRGWLGKIRRKAGVMPHFNALSRLSRYILGWFLASFLVIVGTLVFNPRASFSWPDAVILVATFLQSFFVIYLVHWIFHKSDLSLDAVIKFFAAGFLIAVPTAFFFEGLLVNIILTIAYTAYAIGDMTSGAFSIWFADNYRWLWIIGELVNAYVVAAITEELCKYYTFRCVEHPDLIFLTGLARSSQDARAVAGGMVKYPFSSHQVQETNKRGGSYDDDDVSVSSRSSHRSTRSRSSPGGDQDKMMSEAVLNLDAMPTEEEFFEDEHDVRTHRQRAAAVTTSMISVAVGLACAENFLYVFLLGGSAANSGDVHSGGVIEEWIVLLFRSLFPVHALAAAMQSINMIRKFVECDNDNTHRVGVGRIILPAVLMHGTFDAVLLAINVYIETAWDIYLQKNEGNFDLENPPYNPVLVNVVAWLSIIGVMLGGFLWYFRENRAQRLRLILLEEKQKSTLDGEMAYRNPDAPPTSTPNNISEVELV